MGLDPLGTIERARVSSGARADRNAAQLVRQIISVAPFDGASATSARRDFMCWLKCLGAVLMMRRERDQSGLRAELRLRANRAAVVLVAGIVLSVAGTAQAAPTSETGDPAASQSEALTCAARYHIELGTLGRTEIPRLKSALQTIVEPRLDRPTSWVFWSQRSKRRWRRRGKDGRVMPMRSRGRVCIRERVNRRGRVRCQRWARATPALVARLTRWVPRVNPSPKRAERTQIRFLNDTVKNAGALSAFQTDGRFYWLVRRLVIDLEGYLNQPQSKNMCAGVTTMLSFYREQLEPMEDRIAYVETLARDAQRRLRRQLQIIAKLDAAEAKKARADGEGDGDSDDGGEITAASVTPVAFTPVTEVTTDTVTSAVEALMRNLPPLVELGSAPPAGSIKTLADARLALDAERLPAIPKRRHDAIVRALRAVEARDVAQDTKAIYSDFRDAIFVGLERIAGAHAASCDCAE